MPSTHETGENPLEDAFHPQHDGIYDKLPFGVWMCDTDGGLCYASESFLELLGMSMDEAKGFGWTKRIASEDRDSVDRWKLCVEQEQDWDDEHRIRSPQGTLHTMIARGHAVRGEDGCIERWIGVHLDITERKQAEQRVKDARSFAEAVIETAPEPLVVLDSEHRVISASRAFYRQFRVERKETVGVSMFQLGNGQWAIPALRTLLQDVLAENASFDEYKIEHDFPTIGRRTMLINGRRLRQEGSKAEMSLLVIRDITEAQQKQHQLRTDQETQAVQRERQRLSHRLHDHMQQLLQAARLQLSIVQLSELDEENEAAMEKAQGALEEAGQAARDLAVELTPPVLFESGLEPALKWLTDWVRDKYRLHIDLEVGPNVRLEKQDVCLLLFDTVQELLLNVTKHAQVDTAMVKVERVHGDVVQVVVRDKGVGFDIQDVQTEGGHGTGLGLPTLLSRIEKMGGSFVVRSGKGRGTVTTIRVPLRQE